MMSFDPLGTKDTYTNPRSDKYNRIYRTNFCDFVYSKNSKKASLYSKGISSTGYFLPMFHICVNKKF